MCLTLTILSRGVVVVVVVVLVVVAIDDGDDDAVDSGTDVGGGSVVWPPG